jgi:hypothetical protein
MKIWKRKNKVNPAAPELLSYHGIPVPGIGNTNLVLNKHYAYPVMSVTGCGVLVTQGFSPEVQQTTDDAVEQMLAVTPQSPGGAGVISGDIVFQPLLPENYGD